ncbi:hypothetical protein J437_LFUL004276 [Ladona fulva]|uniref:Uncharacterized protein n=1 Tax=Ladona fulva TaxID=123851 RepID=A0A8K0KF40_LADFU|nr:hypothetical protein J437_LFUL004276 [Ladona fulva]
MLVVSPETFERGQMKGRLGALDAEMKAILSKRNLKGVEKWHMYKRVLDKYLSTLSDINASIGIPIVRAERSLDRGQRVESSSALKKSLEELKEKRRLG